jgi:acetyl-CoA acetyltransferase
MRRGEIVIAGVGQTSFGKHPGRSSVGLNVEACAAALADAGIDKALVDAVWAKVPTSQLEFLYGMKVAAALGIAPDGGGTLDLGGASSIAMIAHAGLAIAAGQQRIALVTMADTPRTGSRAAYERPQGEAAPYGFFGIAAGYALIARAYLERHGASEDDLGAVAKAARRHGAANPAAQLRAPITLADHAASPPIVDPLRRDDCALVSDGASAVVVMAAADARRLGVPRPVPILGVGQGHTAFDLPQRASLTVTGAERSGARALAMAGIACDRVDVAQLYDCFSITPLITLEDYGFCDRGQAGAFVGDGGVEVGGHLPINTSGGLLSESGLPGMQLVVEGARQVRGESVNQVDGAGVSLVSGQGGVMHTHATLVLGG